MEQSKQIKWNGKITVVSVLWLISSYSFAWRMECGYQLHFVFAF